VFCFTQCGGDENEKYLHNHYSNDYMLKKDMLVKLLELLRKKSFNEMKHSIAMGFRTVYDWNLFVLVKRMIFLGSIFVV